jgi:hypothetical protein
VECTEFEVCFVSGAWNGERERDSARGDPSGVCKALHADGGGKDERGSILRLEPNKIDERLIVAREFATIREIYVEFV